MSRYLFTGHYTPGSWARLVKGHDDRTTKARTLAESLGGSLDSVYWDAHTGAAHVIADFPDAVSALALRTTLLRTGAFTDVEAVELLTQDQLSDSLAMSRAAQEFFEAPGAVTVEPAFEGHPV
jgi:uncharacterized protein with GYD domain